MKFITTLLSVALFNFASATVCRDGSTCPGFSTCCLGVRGVSCCPFSNANCCGDGVTCCPAGTRCGPRGCLGSGNPFASTPLTTPTTLAFLDEESDMESSNYNKLDA